MRTDSRSLFHDPPPRLWKVGAPKLMIATAVTAAALLIGGCGGGSTATTSSPDQKAPLGANKNDPTQKRLAKDNPSQNPVGKPRSVKASLGKDNPTQVPLSAKKGGKGAGS